MAELIRSKTRGNRLLQRGLAGFLAALLISGLSLGAQPVAAKANKKEAALPMQDFLPPVATINPRMDETSVQNGEEEAIDEEINFSAVSSPVIHTTPKIERLTGSIQGQFQSEQIQTVMELQKKIDEADLEHLWRATVEKNPVIRFSLEKLATPADLQPKQSSTFLKKTLNTLISGAALGGSMLPGVSSYQNMGVMAISQAAQNMVNGKTQPTIGSLSATEQIQLAGLIDDLKMKLIQSYQDYKNTLQSLAQSHEVTIKNNNLYSKALASKNDLAIMASSTAYYQALLNETTLRQKAKLHRLELERLAGADAVSMLELSVRVGDGSQTANINTDAILIGPEPPPLPDKMPETNAWPMIGPELPSLEPTASQSAPNVNAPLDLYQPLEIGPSLNQDNPPPESPDALQGYQRPSKAPVIAELEPFERMETFTP